MAILGAVSQAHHRISARLRTNLRQGKYVHKWMKPGEFSLQINLYQHERDKKMHYYFAADLNGGHMVCCV
jgi:hypothetical protein